MQNDIVVLIIICPLLQAHKTWLIETWIRAVILQPYDGSVFGREQVILEDSAPFGLVLLSAKS